MTNAVSDEKKTVDAEALRFVTDEGQFTFVRLDAPTEPDNFGNWGYSIEIAWPADAKNQSYKNALATLVESVTGKRALPKDVIRKLEDTAKDPEKNQHLEGKIFSTFKKKCTPKNVDLNDPTERRAWINYLATQQPALFKLNAAGERVEAKPEDIYSGCYGKIIGHCYYAKDYKKFCVAMNYVILTRTDKRIGGGPIDPSRDALLNSVAPAAKDEVDSYVPDLDSADNIPF